MITFTNLLKFKCGRDQNMAPPLPRNFFFWNPACCLLYSKQEEGCNHARNKPREGEEFWRMLSEDDIASPIVPPINNIPT